MIFLLCGMIGVDGVTGITGIRSLRMLLLWEARNKLLFQRQLVDLKSQGHLNGKYVDQTPPEGAKTKEKWEKLLPVSSSSLTTSWIAPIVSCWKLNTNAAWCLITKSGGLGWVLHDHLGQVYPVGLKFIAHCKEVKVLEGMVICSSLESISSLAISNIFVKFHCLEVVKLLNDKD